ncbi:hypothetical protein QN277_000576 [Acacia crassicarpa]|uniref:Bulb-type lectin domain-containing protein n=1 Tax=Acacia crassicarpa TaxID=499986 RepID=A0AAE1N5G8_9FABA|nr:hypothetical protein QN277_000576 [Acacia crassicarpa]
MALEKPYPIFLYLLLALLSHSVVAQPSNNNIISLGTSLTAVENGSFWFSPSGDFAFGFRKIEKEDGFLLAIWFNKIPDKTIIWSAVLETTGDALVAPNGSKVELKSDGLFQLVDPKGDQIWIASPSGNGTDHAAMLDTGNFVLVGHESQNLWQSFDHPSDTILPGQVLHSPAQLVSRYSQNNFSRGKFLLRLQDDGNLVLWTTHYPMTLANIPYWESHVFGDGFSLVFNQTGSIFVQSSNKIRSRVYHLMLHLHKISIRGLLLIMMEFLSAIPIPRVIVPVHGQLVTTYRKIFATKLLNIQEVELVDSTATVSLMMG